MPTPRASWKVQEILLYLLVRVVSIVICSALVAASAKGQNHVAEFYSDYYLAIEDYLIEHDSTKLIYFYDDCTKKYLKITKPVKFGVMRALKISFPTHPEVACKLLELAIAKGYDSLDILYFIDKTHPTMLSDTCVVKLLNNFSECRFRNYSKDINLYKFDILNQIFYRDQFVREETFRPYLDSNLALMGKIDSLNSIALYEYMNEYGYPSCEDIGNTIPHYTVLMHILFQHNSITLPNGENSYDYFYNKLYQAVKQGKMWNVLFADLVDRSLTNDMNSRKPKYRVLATDRNNSNLITEVNKNRADIYLPPLEKAIMINSFIYGQ